MTNIANIFNNSIPESLSVKLCAFHFIMSTPLSYFFNIHYIVKRTVKRDTDFC